MRKQTGIVLLLGLLAACSSGQPFDSGRVQVFVTAEDTIPFGLDPGTGPGNIRDGWTVRYSKFLVTVGNFRAARVTDPGPLLVDNRVVVVDLLRLPTSGFVLSEFAGVPAARWARVGYDLPNADTSVGRATFTPQGDYAEMVSGGYSLYFEATLTNPSGMSCRRGDPNACVARTSLVIRWGVRAGTSFDNCTPSQGDAGFAVPSGGTVQVEPTVHGDHWFFSNITQGAELTERRAQWIADSDLNQDGETTIDELRMITATDVLPPPTYNLTGALIPINTAYDYLEAQARTLGDFQGEGECPTRSILQ